MLTISYLRAGGQVLERLGELKYLGYWNDTWEVTGVSLTDYAICLIFLLVQTSIQYFRVAGITCKAATRTTFNAEGHAEGAVGRAATIAAIF